MKRLARRDDRRRVVRIGHGDRHRLRRRRVHAVADLDAQDVAAGDLTIEVRVVRDRDLAGRAVDLEHAVAVAGDDRPARERAGRVGIRRCHRTHRRAVPRRLGDVEALARRDHRRRVVGVGHRDRDRLRGRRVHAVADLDRPGRNSRHLAIEVRVVGDRDLTRRAVDLEHAVAVAGDDRPAGQRAGRVGIRRGHRADRGAVARRPRRSRTTGSP